MAEALLVRPLATSEEQSWCAELMAASDPWRTLGFPAAALRRALGRPGREGYLALRGSERVGCLALELQGALVGYVRAICVAPGARGQGCGSALLAFAEQRIFRDWPNVFLCVSSFNEGARRFYARHGYGVVGELSDFLVAGRHEILMRKTRGPLRGGAPGRGVRHSC